MATTGTHLPSPCPSGAFPTSAVNDGSYKRFVTAFKLHTGELILPLASDNVAITSGDYLCLDAYNTGLDKYTGSTASMKVCQALESKSANSGGYIIVHLYEDAIPFLE